MRPIRPIEQPFIRDFRQGAHLAASAAVERVLAAVSSNVATHCPYCALQCGMHLMEEPAGIRVIGNQKFPVNEGGLCVKGWSAASILDHPDRLRTPLVRSASGRL